MVSPMERLSRRYTVFAIMWVLAVLFHMIHRSDVVSGILPALTVLAGGYVLLKPRKEIRLVVFSLCHALVYISNAPNTGNHEFLTFLIELIIVVLWVHKKWQASRFQGTIFLFLIPLLKWSTILLYFFAVFHKLNWNYLNPNSCGGTMLLDVLINNEPSAQLFSGFSSKNIMLLKYGSIYMSLLLEMLIPLLLLHRRFAWIGCLLGILLHGALGFIYFWHFTPLLYALFVLFLPDDFFDHIYNTFLPYKQKNKKLKRSILGLMLLIPLLYFLKDYFPIIGSELGNFSRNTNRNWSLGFNLRSFLGWLPFLIYSIAFLYFVISAPRTTTKLSRVKLPKAYYLFVILLIVNGFSPYLGIKTHQSFSMFSGLMTHENKNNHLFMPTVNIVQTQMDVVTPCQQHHTNYPKRLRWQKDEKLVYYELQKRVTSLSKAGIRDIELCFMRKGKSVTLYNAERDSSLIIPINWLDRNFRIYREIPIDTNRCFY